MKKVYEKPEVEVIDFTAEQIMGGNIGGDIDIYTGDEGM